MLRRKVARGLGVPLVFARFGPCQYVTGREYLSGRKSRIHPFRSLIGSLQAVRWLKPQGITWPVPLHLRGNASINLRCGLVHKSNRLLTQKFSNQPIPKKVCRLNPDLFMKQILKAFSLNHDGLSSGIQ
jgi:hypothetical protein